MSAAKSQLNNSTAKACFSFSKAPRSPKPEKHKYFFIQNIAMQSMTYHQSAATDPPL